MKVTYSGVAPASLLILAALDPDLDLDRATMADAFSPPTGTRPTHWLGAVTLHPQFPMVTSRDTMRSPSSAHSSNEASSSDAPRTRRDDEKTLRDRLRQVTGFSWTAVRATMRTMTGISLTAMWLSAVAFSSVLIRNIMAFFVRIFPTWFRYFLQPFLVLYYVPLIAIRGMTGPNRKEKLASHDAFVKHIKEAVLAADEAQNGGYWPVQINDDGMIEAVRPPDPNQEAVDMTEALVQSVEVAQEQEEKKNS